MFPFACFFAVIIANLTKNVILRSGRSSGSTGSSEGLQLIAMLTAMLTLGVYLIQPHGG